MNTCLQCGSSVKNKYCNSACQNAYQREHKLFKIKNSEQHKENCKVAREQKLDSMFGKVIEFNINCYKCQTTFSIFEREQQFPKKEKYYCSKKCANSRLHSEQTKQKISDTNKGRKLTTEQQLSFINGIKNYHTNKLIIVKNIKKTELAETTCLYCAQLIYHRPSVKRKYHNECWKKCSGGLRENSTIKHSCNYSGSILDSGSELEFVKFCEKNEVNWIKNSTVAFPYIGIDMKQHNYFPDFFLPDFNYWVEIKGKLYADLDPNIEIKKELIDNYIFIDSKDVKKLKYLDFIKLIQT